MPHIVQAAGSCKNLNCRDAYPLTGSELPALWWLKALGLSTDNVILPFFNHFFYNFFNHQHNINNAIVYKLTFWQLLNSIKVYTLNESHPDIYCILKITWKNLLFVLGVDSLDFLNEVSEWVVELEAWWALHNTVYFPTGKKEK